MKEPRKWSDPANAWIERRVQGATFELKVLVVYAHGLPTASYLFEGVSFRLRPGSKTSPSITAVYSSTPRWAKLLSLQKIPQGLKVEIVNGFMGTRDSVDLEGPLVTQLCRRINETKGVPEDCWRLTRSLRDYLARNLRA